MSDYHTVQQGEHMSSIAKLYGFLDYRTLWNHSQNAQLKATRQNPNVLFPGDTVFVPDREQRVVPKPTDQRHKFKLKAPGLKLRVILEDQYEKPIANAACALAIDGEYRRITTDGDGKIEQDIPRDARGAVVIIQDGQTPFDSTEIPIQIGDLDPVEEVSGQRGRLTNLGYLAADAAEDDDDTFRSAVEEFQCDQGLAVDGICGPVTQAKLKQVHGC